MLACMLCRQRVLLAKPSPGRSNHLISCQLELIDSQTKCSPITSAEKER